MIRTRNLEQYAELHRTRRYGDTGVNKRKIIEPWIQIEKPTSMLDYGAGQSHLINHIRCSSLLIRDRYDPAIAEIAEIPRSGYDLIICTDVFEHFDEDEAPKVLKEISQLTRKAIFGINTKVAKTILPNGENAHATVRSPEWWLMAVRQHFPDSEIFENQTSSVYIKTWKSTGFAKGIAWILRRKPKFLRRDP